MSSQSNVVPVVLEKLNEFWRTNNMPTSVSKNYIEKLGKKGELNAQRCLALLDFDKENETHNRICNDRCFRKTFGTYLKTLVSHKKGKEPPFMEGIVGTEESRNTKWEGICT